MNFVYMDESGMSPREPRIVVAGIIVNGDHQLPLVEQHIEDLVNEYVVGVDREGFIFHAKEILSGSGKVWGNRTRYSLPNRIEALKAILMVPRRFLLPMVFGHVRKRENESLATNHGFAFSLAVVAAESILRDKTPDEVAQLVVELNTQTERALEKADNVLKGHDLHLEESARRFEVLSETAPGVLPIKKLRHGAHFVTKRNAPAIQIADACATIIRYHIEKHPDSPQFVDALTNNNPTNLDVTPESLETAGFTTLAYRPKQLA